jgi:hypothetical protein
MDYANRPSCQAVVGLEFSRHAPARIKLGAPDGNQSWHNPLTQWRTPPRWLRAAA